MTRTYYKCAAGAMLVFDITDTESFQHVKEWLEEVRQQASKNVSVVLVGNKTDLESKRVISTEEAKNLANENNMPYIETSAMTAQNISKAFDILAENICTKIENGQIDVTREDSGIKLGTEVNIEKSENLQSVQLKKSKPKEESSCACQLLNS
eukprot:TRINITY_DN2274_c0_g1_i3.p1 TRINITY_DN2274_c0_g1~~TRINITY_DN2274_c0_g1_i3.p1  ORF type:complete len:153 (+),score=18.07 TRINITY_DN2274_c0_g1_i3:310-768(+)